MHYAATTNDPPFFTCLLKDLMLSTIDAVRSYPVRLSELHREMMDFFDSFA